MISPHLDSMVRQCGQKSTQWLQSCHCNIRAVSRQWSDGSDRSQQMEREPLQRTSSDGSSTCQHLHFLTNVAWMNFIFSIVLRNRYMLIRKDTFW